MEKKEKKSKNNSTNKNSPKPNNRRENVLSFFSCTWDAEMWEEVPGPPSLSKEPSSSALGSASPPLPTFKKLLMLKIKQAW